MPNSRNPERNVYCSTVRQYKDYKIGFGKGAKERAKDLIARYVFGTDYLSRDANTRSELTRWSGARHRWLNLVNCNTTNAHRREETFSTIEFRIFPPTTNPEKIHFWVLVCQAFVWFVENRPRMIEDSDVTLKSMLKEAYEGKKIYEFVTECLTKYNYKKNGTRKTKNDSGRPTW